MKTALRITFSMLYLSFFACSYAVGQNSKVIEIKTKSTSLVYGVTSDNRLIFQYYGKAVDDSEAFMQQKFYPKPDTNRDFSYDAYPTFGLGNINEPALSVIHADGSLNTELFFESEETKSDVTETVIHLKDRIYDFAVDLHTKAYWDEDVISQWTVISNNENGQVKLTNFASAFLPLKAESYYLTHFYGAWAGEMNVDEEKLENGIKVIESKKGVRTTQTENPSFILSLNHPALENDGDCYGGALAWSGNYRLAFQVDEWKTMNVVTGINPFMSAWTLKEGESFTTPEMIYTYSCDGRGQVSRNLHDWGRKYGMVGGHQTHDIVLNSWEGAYFTFNENTLTGMMDDAAQMGIETFVLDDGWFGNKYPRNSDHAGLGDWQTNTKKLPRGLRCLIDYAHTKGLKFGLWIEPEMVNPESELAGKHPEWIVQSAGREKITWRNQLLLDLSNPRVQDFVYNVFDSLLTTHPGIEYIKWDANRHVEQAGSTWLPETKQTHFWISYTKGLYAVYDRIRAKYPDLVIQDCASGGGRLDYGALKYHNEYWTSDNTDPLSRIFIQYGTNLIYPPVGAASHVSTSPNHQTQRITPLKFRFDVAMTGRLGMELQPKTIQGKDREFAEEAIKNYKQIVRPLVTDGDLYRLKSPYDEGGWASQMYVSKDKSLAVLFVFSLKPHLRGVFPTLKLNGLDNSKTYQISEINQSGWPHFWGNGQTFKAGYLIGAGLEIGIHGQFDSAVFILKETESR